MTHVRIIVPCYERPEPEMTLALIAETHDLTAHGVAWSIDFEQRMAGCGRPRNRGIAAGLHSNATHFLLWDADNYPLEPGAIRTLLATGHEVIGSAIVKRDGSGEFVYRPLESADGSVELPIERGAARVKYVGGGFLLIARRVIEHFRDDPTVRSYASEFAIDRGRREWAIFEEGPVDGVWTADDWVFCARCTDAGIPVWMHIGVRHGHVGKRAFTDRFLEGRS